MVFGATFWALCALGALAAVAYGLFFVGRPPSLIGAALKTAFMGALTIAFSNAGAHPFLFAALAASAFGDLFLAYDKKWLVPLGILAFLAAQLAYFLIFMGIWFAAPDGSPHWLRYAAMAIIVATSLGFLIWMAPKLGWMALGVVP